MSQVEIHLESTRFEPGARVEGRVSWVSGGKRPESVVVSLLWHTAGKGTEDVEVVEKTFVEEPAPAGDRSFEFLLPDFPWSFSGTLVSLVWAVEASLEPDGDVSRVDLVSAPGAEEIVL